MPRSVAVRFSAVLLMLLSSFAPAFAAAKASAPDRPRIVAYLPTWHDFPAVIDTLDLERVTHLMIAFGNPATDDPRRLILPASLDIAVRTASARGVSVLVSIGGAVGEASAYAHALHPDNVDAFVAALRQAVLDHDLAGIDVDIEHQVLHADTHAPARYEAFVVKLRAALHAEGKLITAALATSFADAITPRAAAQFDFINLMSYDATGPWRPDSPGQHSSLALAAADLEFWQTRKGIPRDRLVVGVPFYGWAWGRHAAAGERVSALTYREIVALRPDAHAHDQLGAGADAVYYNGIPTIRRKARLGAAAGGVMIWQILGDTRDERSLLRAIHEELHASPTPPPSDTPAATRRNGS